MKQEGKEVCHFIKIIIPILAWSSELENEMGRFMNAV